MRLFLLAAPLVALLLPPNSPAQSTALLTGTVVDASGAVVPEARVTCKHVETGVQSQTTTNTAGLFRFPNLPVGMYELAVAREGFATLVRGGIELLTGQTLDLSLALTVGQTSQSVEVSVPAPLVQSTTSDLGTTVDSREMSDLPLNGRNAFDLALMTAGAVDTVANTVPGQADNDGLAVNGLRAVDNNFELDGGTYTNRSYGSAPVLPNPDTLQEFTARTSNFSAASRGAGASVKLTTRSGTNQFHGTLFEFLRNDLMDARNFFALAPAGYKQNQYGGTLGGPIRKHKLFFFGSFQGTNKRGSPSPRSTTVPTALQRGGDFSRGARIVVDPLSGAPFPNNFIPQSRHDSIALRLLEYVPLPNAGGNTLVMSPSAARDDYQWLAKIDYVVTSKDQLSFRYFWDRNTTQRDVTSLPAFYPNNRYTNQSILISDTHTFGQSWVLRGSFNYLRNYRKEIPMAPFTMQDLGAKAPPAGPDIGDKIGVFINGYASLRTGNGAVMNPSVKEVQLEASHPAGRHFLRFGTGFRHNVEKTLAAGADFGEWTFNANRTTSAAVRNSGEPFAGFLLGLPSNFLQESGNSNHFVVTTFDPWVQDDWKVSRTVTLNLGLRWDPWLPPHDANGYLPGFLPGMQSTIAPLAPVGLVFGGDPGIPASIARNAWKSFSPRFGLAWDLLGDGRTVIRGGYGIFRAGTEFFGLIRTLANSAPFRSAIVRITNPPSTADPYAGYGAIPFPYTQPSSLADYRFANNVAVRAMDARAHAGYTQSWNFTVERQVARDTAVTVSYVGNHSLGILTRYAANPAIYGPGATVSNENSRRLYTGFGDLTVGGSGAYGNYHGLQAQLTKRARRGLTVLANYTWSKGMSVDSSGSFGSALGEGPRNPLNLSLDYSPADYDVTQQAKIALLYDLPRFSSGPRPFRAMVNGWQINSMVVARTGFPFTCRSGVDNSLSSVGNDTCDQIDARSARPAGADPMRMYFNTAAFTTNAIGTFGSSGRNNLRRPGSFNVNLSVFRHFPITEKLRVELRGEAFNALNHPVFDLFYNPSGYKASLDVTSPDFGKITYARDPRLMQVALKLRF